MNNVFSRLAKYEDDLYGFSYGEVDNYASIHYEKGTCYLIKNGKVDKTATGVRKWISHYYYFENGVQNFDYDWIASDEYGNWYLIEDGEVATGTSGIYIVNGFQYIVRSGRVYF